MWDVPHLIAVTDANDLGKVVLDDAEVVAVIGNVGGEEQRVASSDDALLAQPGRAPVHFQGQLIRLDDLRRLGEAFTELGEKGDIPASEGAPVTQRRIGELPLAKLGRAMHERHRSRIIPLGLRPCGQDETARGCHHRDKTEHDERISRGVDSAASAEPVTSERFLALARSAEGAHTLIPVWRDVLLDTDTPVSAFAKLRRGAFAFLLESAPAGGETWARYTFLGTEPRSAWRLKAGTVEDWNAERGWHNPRRPPDPLADLAALVDAAKPANAPEVGQFWGGVVGFFSYDMVRVIEELPVREKPSLGAPDALFVFTRSLVILDNLHGRARVVISVPTPRGASAGELDDLFDQA